MDDKLLNKAPEIKEFPKVGIAFVHPCSICGASFAPWGYGVRLNTKEQKLGQWFCTKHRPKD